VTAVDCDPAGRRVVSGGLDHKLLLWNIAEGVVTKVYDRSGYHEAAILSVRWSYEDDLFASCAADASVYLWSTKYDIPLISFIGHHYAVDCLVFINSHKLLSSGRDSFILVWDIKAGGVVDSERTHGKSVQTKVRQPALPSPPLLCGVV
jgi:WD40 repeat protein